MEEELADIPEFLVGYQSLPHFARSALVIGPLSFVLGFFLATNKCIAFQYKLVLSH